MDEEAVFRDNFFELSQADQVMQIGMWTEEMQKAFLFTDHNLTEQLSDEELEASSEVEKSAFTVAALKAARAKKAAEAIGWKSHQATPLTSHRSRELLRT